jgi:hypothetical protein
MEPLSPSELRAVADRQEIHELLARYSEAVDAKRWDLLESVFVPGAVVDFRGNGGPELPYPEIVQFLVDSMGGFAGCQHYATNLQIGFGADGDSATCRSYVFTYLSSIVDGDEVLFADGGWYVDELVRTPAGWRMARRTSGLVWIDGPWPEGVPRPGWWGKPGDRYWPR